MKNALLVFLFLFSFFPIHALGKWHDMQGNTLEDTEWMKSSDDFGAQLLLVGNEEEFLKRWETPSKIFNTKTISEIKRGEPFITPIIFSGCYTNSDGNCIVTTDIANMLLVGAAKWSLSSNAVQHEAVLKTCKRFSESENPRIKQGIAEVLEKANEMKAQQQNAAYWRPRGASKSVLLAGAL